MTRREKQIILNAFYSLESIESYKDKDIHKGRDLLQMSINELKKVLV